MIDIEAVERDRHLAREAEWATERTRLETDLEHWRTQARKWETRARLNRKERHDHLPELRS